MVEIAFTNRFALLDRLIQHGLRKERLIPLIVAKPPVRIHVNDDVASEFAAKVHRKLNDLSYSFGIFAVDMENRNLKHLRHVCGIDRRLRFLGCCCKTDLVVDDNVQRSTDRVTFELAKIQGFLNDPFSCERCVAMDENDKAMVALVIVCAILFGAHSSERNGIHEFEVARIEAKRKVDGFSGRGLPFTAVSEVVLHVAAAHVQIGIEIRELTENLARALCHDVRQNIQTAAVSHAHHNFIDALSSGALDSEVEQRYQAFRTLKRENSSHQ